MILALWIWYTIDDKDWMVIGDVALLYMILVAQGFKHKAGEIQDEGKTQKINLIETWIQFIYNYCFDFCSLNLVVVIEIESLGYFVA